jgi:hypothetical protein
MYRAIIVVALLAAPAWTQCSISNPSPIGVVAGQCVQLQATCGTGMQWSLVGDGTINAGQYCAPATVFVQNSARGAQNLPNDSVPNVPVQTWPVHPSSTQWLARWTSAGAQQSYFTIKLGAGPRYQKNFPIQHSDQTTPQQIWNAVYSVGNYQNVLAPLVQPPNAEMQAGLYMDPYGAAQQGTGPDRHNEDQEVLSNGLAIANEHYQLMPDSHNTACTPGAVTTCQFDTNLILPLPSIFRIQINGVTGACSGMNFNGTAASSFLATRVSEVPGSGYAYHVVMTLPYNSSACTAANFASAYLAGSASNCAACNTGTMAQWQNWSNQSLRSTTAGGLPLQATSVDPNRWYSNVKNNLTDPSCKGSDGLPRVVANSHVVGFTLPNSMISAANLGGSTTGNQVAGGHPFMQIGSCTPGNPTTCTMVYNLGTGGLDACEAPTPWLSVPAAPGTCSFHIRFSGLTGGWAALNDNADHSASYLATGSQFSFTIPVDSSSFGAGTWNGNQWLQFDWAPYGSVWRLDATQLNPDSITDPFEKALLWEGACYGFVLDDGTNGLNDSLDSRINSSGFAPDELVTVATELSTLTVAPYLKIVDPAGTQPNPYSTTGNQFLTTNFRRTTVTVTGSAGSYSADVNLVGTAIGIGDQSERLPSIPAGGTYTPHIWVTGNVNTGYSCAFETAISGASVTTSGTITAPASVTALTAFKLKCTGSADPTVISYASGYFVPKAANGNIYLGIGQLHTSFTDTTGNVWWGQIADRQWSGSGGLFQSPDGCDYCPLYGTFNENPSGWSGVTNGQLYGESISARNDAAEWIALPNGNYNLTVYGEAGLGVNAAGGSVYDIEVNGTTVDSWVDSYVRAGGTYRPYTKTYQVTVTNGVLSFIARDRQDTTAAVYGMSPWAAIMISPSSAPPSNAVTLSNSTIQGLTVN